MPHLILIKHSLPEINEAVPASQWHLSQEGRQRCQVLAERLAHFQVSRVFSSIEPKAQETAQLVALALGVPHETAPGLHELDRSNVTALNTQEQFENNVRRLFERPDQLVFGTETAHQAYERFAQTVHHLVARHPDQDVVLVAHGTVITLLVCAANAIEPFSFWKRLGLPAVVIVALPKMELVSIVEHADDRGTTER